MSSDIDKNFKADMDEDFELLDPKVVAAAKVQALTVSEVKASAIAMGMTLGQLLGLVDPPIVVDMPPRYTHGSVIFRQARVAHVGGVAHRPTGRPSC